jgi:hypothetical protein
MTRRMGAFIDGRESRDRQTQSTVPQPERETNPKRISLFTLCMQSSAQGLTNLSSTRVLTKRSITARDDGWIGSASADRQASPHHLRPINQTSGTRLLARSIMAKTAVRAAVRTGCQRGHPSCSVRAARRRAASPVPWPGFPASPPPQPPAAAS